MKNQLHRESVQRSVYPILLSTTLLLGSTLAVAGPPGQWSFPHIDKVVHVAVYGLLSTAFCRIAFNMDRKWSSWWLGVFCGFAVGLTDEGRQFSNPSRFFEWADLFANFIGAVVASTAYVFWPMYRGILEMSFRKSGG